MSPVTILCNFDFAIRRNEEKKGKELVKNVSNKYKMYDQAIRVLCRREESAHIATRKRGGSKYYGVIDE